MFAKFVTQTNVPETEGVIVAFPVGSFGYRNPPVFHRIPADPLMVLVRESAGKFGKSISRLHVYLQRGRRTIQRRTLLPPSSTPTEKYSARRAE